MATPVDIDRLLARHTERRRQGLATVSVLVGPAPAAATAWRGHDGRDGVELDPAVVGGDPSALSTVLLALTCERAPLLTASVVVLGRRLGRPPGDVLANRSTYDLEQLWRVVPTDGTEADGDVLTAMRLICTRPVDRWAGSLSTDLPGWRALVALDRLLARGGRRPPVWVTSPDNTGRWLATVAGPVAALVTAVPTWPVGVGVPATAFAAFAATAGSGRADTLITGGFVPVSATISGGGPGPVARRARSAVVRRADEARSDAERQLFAALEARWPGLFALNRPLGFRFGRRPAEADLFAADLRLVIEVDGYHHFTDAGRFRRDRRKDWLYQAHGYRYVRVLAADVMAAGDEILDPIRRAVDHCRRHVLGRGPTGIA